MRRQPCNIMAMHDIYKLECALITHNFNGISVEELHRKRLASFAHPLLKGEPQLQSKIDYLDATARHLRIKTEIEHLIGVWLEHDILTLLFKGFYLAEFIYDVPARRFYEDVDVLIHTNNVTTALCVAATEGWTIEGQRAASLQSYSHAECSLVSPSGLTYVDMHRLVLQSISPQIKVQSRITKLVWEAAERRSWRGHDVMTLSVTDSAIVGLMLNRFWSPDNWTLHLHDYPDLEMLIKRGKLDKSDLLARAKTLGCSQTVQLFLSRCNPWQHQLKLSEPTFVQRQRWALWIIFERGHIYADDIFGRSVDVLQTAFDMIYELPLVCEALILLHAPASLKSFIQKARVGSRQLEQRQRSRVLNGTKGWLRVIKPWMHRSKQNAFQYAITSYVLQSYGLEPEGNIGY